MRGRGFLRRRPGRVPLGRRLPACPTKGKGRSTAGFTLLEMIVATMIMAIAVVGLLAGISGATRNAARVRDYDRIVQLARLRMNDLLVNPAVSAGGTLSGTFNPLLTGGTEAGWEAKVALLEAPPNPVPGAYVIDRIELQIWWINDMHRRTFTLEGLRERQLSADSSGTAVK